jgi:hypothetical protein
MADVHVLKLSCSVAYKDRVQYKNTAGDGLNIVAHTAKKD